MKIVHRYLGALLLRNFALCLSGLTTLFIVFDFFDRIDNIVAEKPDFWIVVQYFFYKIPVMMSHVMPISMLAATMLTLGLLSKNSEVTAMRASGMSIFWITKPVIVVGFMASLASMLLNESVVPYAARRVREIYNLDIRKKDERGGYSQSDFWWRSGNDFFAVSYFDSRNDELISAVRLELDNNFEARSRTDAQVIKWIDPALGWSMRQVTEFTFHPEGKAPDKRMYHVMPLPIRETPRDFYSAETDPQTMSYSQLKEFIKKQAANGLPVSGYYADLYNKISFPFITLIVALVALPFSLKPARSGSMASSIMAALTIGFTYYAVHSLSISMGRAEIWPAMLAAWMASIIMGLVALFLNLGAEAPA
ncbi:MAG: LPS export ABC transporter permease LptG [Deltaproteobacteria bacterium]|nr:LPS export ABC transporter permease LptG [Deltaproteobacteria bacterium]